jgi:hypothetical protein
MLDGGASLPQIQQVFPFRSVSSLSEGANSLGLLGDIDRLTEIERGEDEKAAIANEQRDDVGKAIGAIGQIFG